MNEVRRVFMGNLVAFLVEETYDTRFIFDTSHECHNVLH